VHVIKNPFRALSLFIVYATEDDYSYQCSFHTIVLKLILAVSTCDRTCFWHCVAFIALTAYIPWSPSEPTSTQASVFSSIWIHLFHPIPKPVRQIIPVFRSGDFEHYTQTASEFFICISLLKAASFWCFSLRARPQWHCPLGFVFSGPGPVSSQVRSSGSYS
jgi:hypothetical protein